MAVSSDTAGINLEKFFDDVGAIEDDLDDLQKLHHKLDEAHQESKTARTARSLKDLRARMGRDVGQSLNKAKLIKVRLEALDRANDANRIQPGCGPGTVVHRTRTVVVAELRKKLKTKMDEFQELRERINGEYKETMENPDQETVSLLICTGESDSFLQKAIQLKGRRQILDTIAETQERRDAVPYIERGLMELHQVFLDMALLVQHQGEQLNGIVEASEAIKYGARELHIARKHQQNTHRKWTCFALFC